MKRYQKKIKGFVCLLGGLALHSIYAQETPVSSGGDASGTNGTVSYSIGQVVYTTYTGSNGSVAQGVQQPYEISTSGVDNLAGITLEMVLYPNPTTSFVYLKVDESYISSLDFVLYDSEGKQLMNEKIKQATTQIPMENLAPAIYFLHVLLENKTQKTFKIIKNNLY